MANKSNGKRKSQEKTSKAKEKEKPSTPHEDIESLQITFYEIESWIEKTTPILTRMTKELEKASTHFEKRRKETATTHFNIDTKNLEEKLLNMQQKQLDWKHELLEAADQQQQDTVTDNSPMQWRLSFQPGNMLRLDTNITSVEELIQAVQKIKIMQEQDISPPGFASPASSATAVDSEDDKALEVILCSSPNLISMPQDASAVEYWHYAVSRRPKISLDNYKHCHMNLNGLTKNISPTALNYIGQVCWDCLHPKFSSDWNSFWDRSIDPERNQVCTDSGLAMMFIHVMRHDKHICDNAQSIAGFYFDRARDKMMDFFDEESDCAIIEALLNLSLFCTVCKEYSQTKIYIGLAYHMLTERGYHKEKNLPKDDLESRKNFLKLMLIVYYNDYMVSVYLGETPLIKDEDLDIDFYEIITLNEKLCELNKTKEMKDQVDFDKTVIRESYTIHMIEITRLTKQINIMVQHGSTLKQLLALENKLKQWYNRLPNALNNLDYDFDLIEKTNKGRDICTPMDLLTLQAQASVLLKIQYESAWIILHKAILNSIRSSVSKGVSSFSLSEQERKSNILCSNYADSVVKISEVMTRCFGWCICQQIVIGLYHASTVYCANALNKESLELRNKARLMILRIIRILEAGSEIYEGFPGDLTECLCEFLKKHGMHNSLECSCKCTDNPSSTASIEEMVNDFIEEDIDLFTSFHEESYPAKS